MIEICLRTSLTDSSLFSRSTFLSSVSSSFVAANISALIIEFGIEAPDKNLDGGLEFSVKEELRLPNAKNDFCNLSNMFYINY